MIRLPEPSERYREIAAPRSRTLFWRFSSDASFPRVTFARYVRMLFSRLFWPTILARYFRTVFSHAVFARFFSNCFLLAAVL